eukprot:CAMPEP_0177195808 /NCGR_PEP_ID=MMETSP0367-20130122/23714_1 /TAXON_ID=447022 ORGANISM="Scrippsiella hangoei-like, Strain SHHI-4" /NCGR_SAMPLE_ID=MMETSP0367 /ASSEMBLY_ACC=CAM_ASM_000362 /LENGTH=180 /DNA_ID=CAMNT_0018643867 /DNA_START=56 /DNA_END=598 /DNA_ORIENTATION=-
MKLSPLVVASSLVASVGAASVEGRQHLRHLEAEASQATKYTLAQYRGNFCTGRYVALELTLGMMTQISLPEGRSPEVLCNKLVGDDSGKFVVHSCPGSAATGCPLHCDGCHEDMVKHFAVGQCTDGWMLFEGDVCTADNADCISKNKVDVGLARWCNRWPAPGVPVYKVKDAEELDPPAE